MIVVEIVRQGGGLHFFFYAEEEELKLNTSLLSDFKGTVHSKYLECCLFLEIVSEFWSFWMG